MSFFSIINSKNFYIIAKKIGVTRRSDLNIQFSGACEHSN
jgi:hypothetical protein